MKKTSITSGGFSIFMNPKIECTLENGPILRGVGQVTVYKNTEGEWESELELVDLNEIVFMGITITDYKNIRQNINYFQEMGINLNAELYKAFEEMFNMSGDIKTFVFEHTGIKLN